MRLAKDEVIGLVVAAIIGGSALGLYVYRQVAAPPVATTTTSATTATATPRADTQDARDAFGERLETAFREDGVPAVAYADGTTLHLRWIACSKAILNKLLDKRDDATTRNLRKLSGLSRARLEELGFTMIVCDDTGKRVTKYEL